MNFLTEEPITLPSHSFVFNPDTFLEDVDPENSTNKVVPYRNENELLDFGIHCGVEREISITADGDSHYKYSLDIWTRGCEYCDNSSEVTTIRSGDKLVILGYADYVVVRKEKN